MPVAIRALLMFGANTDVGKTLLSAALCRGAAAHFGSDKVAYLKPIQTGYPTDSDSRFVAKFCPGIYTSTLFTFQDAISPHLAAIRENRPISDESVLAAVETELANFSEKISTEVKSAIKNKESKFGQTPHDNNGFILIETAGGNKRQSVNSPAISSTLQSTLYKKYPTTNFPATLVGDTRLGGISTTLCSYESLISRGYTVPLILMAANSADNAHANHEIISRNVNPTTRVVVVPAALPVRVADPVIDAQNVELYFKNFCDAVFFDCIKFLK
ncbi:hypothetical protein HK100_010014 [Physocladia obscura]|uniref:Dethiobiotin synthase n=1 Tax=Physocladia obscura TaxID=109957 RepID=A0AAD5XEW2_9FUNG|nr:hypothetical protein HK100_010014 [Physocladia obscura]